MRPTLWNARLPIAAVLGAAVATAALVGPAKAGDGDRPFDEQIIHNLLTGLGLQDPNAVQPTYEERPPLVIPKSDALPPPQKPGAAIAENPAWPKDPDVERAKERARRERNEVRRTAGEEFRDQESVLRPDQLNPTGRGAGQSERASTTNTPDYEGRHTMTPSQLGYKGGVFSNIFGSDDKDEETARFTGEPARTALTEPPPGYQTPSPDQPYGVGAKNLAPKADNNYLTRGEINQNQ